MPETMIHAHLSRSKVFAESGAGGRVLTVGASPEPQQIPEWVMRTPTWESGASDGSIRQVIMVDSGNLKVRAAGPELPYGLGGPDPNVADTQPDQKPEETIEVVSPATLTRRRASKRS